MYNMNTYVHASCFLNLDPYATPYSLTVKLHCSTSTESLKCLKDIYNYTQEMLKYFAYVYNKLNVIKKVIGLILGSVFKSIPHYK